MLPSRIHSIRLSWSPAEAPWTIWLAGSSARSKIEAVEDTRERGSNSTAPASVRVPVGPSLPGAPNSRSLEPSPSMSAIPTPRPVAMPAVGP